MLEGLKCMKRRKDYLLFRIIRGLIWLFSPKMKVVGRENLPEEACVIVGNHCQIYGPIACELYFPKTCYTWCAGQMMHAKDVAEYAYQDFWSQKSKYSRWYYKMLSHLIVPLSVCIFNNARTIGVYHDARIMSTFKDTIRKLQNGSNIVIFPEHDVKYNHVVYEFQNKFVDIAKLYHKKTGKELAFVPLYIAPRLKKMYLGKPISFCSSSTIEEERKRICTYLQAEITEMAEALPPHIVVPYRNIPKKYYPYNCPKEVTADEKTGC